MFRIALGLFLTWTSPAAFGFTCPNPSQFRDIKEMTHTIAIIGKDDRVVRDKSNLDLEAAQGRIYCLSQKFPNKAPTKSQIMNEDHHVANAVLAFDSDVALVNRHVFFNTKNGKQNQKKENCFFEHVASGDIVAIADWEWPPTPVNPKDLQHQDVAVLRLKASPNGGKPVPSDDIVIDREHDLSAPITVVSNYAANLKNPESLTITSCHRFGFYRLTTNAISNVWGTDCDTGDGSSGAQVYLQKDGKPKLIGLIKGDIKEVPEGGAFDPHKLSTAITQFDESLFEAYDRLKKRTSI